MENKLSKSQDLPCDPRKQQLIVRIVAKKAKPLQLGVVLTILYLGWSEYDSYTFRVPYA